MTILRKDPDGISSYFDRLFQGVGHRGSSFTDVDRLEVVHDGGTDRFLVMEFKELDEEVSAGQHRALCGLAALPNVDVWILRRAAPGLIEQSRPPISSVEALDEGQLRRRFAEWWNPGTSSIEEACPHGNGSTTDCNWCWRESA